MPKVLQFSAGVASSVTSALALARAGAMIILALLAATPRAAAYVSATGGNTTNDIAGWRVHTFTNSGTFTVTSSGAVEYLIIGGGGGGGCGDGGGGRIAVSYTNVVANCGVRLSANCGVSCYTLDVSAPAWPYAPMVGL